MQSHSHAVRAFVVAALALALALVTLPAFAEPGSVSSKAAEAAESALLAGELQPGSSDQGASSQDVQYVYLEEVNPIYAEELAGVDLFDEEAAIAKLSQPAEQPAEQPAGQPSSGLLSLQADAGDGEIVDETSETDESGEQAAVQSIRSALLEHADSATVTVTIGADDDMNDVFFRMLYAAFAEPDVTTDQEKYIALVDYLRYEYSGVDGGYRWYPSDPTVVTFQYNFIYMSSKEQSVQLLADAKTKVESFKFETTTSDYQKLKTIYDFICGHVTYDYAHLDNDGYLLKYSAYAALENGTAVCQGYSQLLYVMCGYAGVPTRVVAGWGFSEYGNYEAHAWNIAGLAAGGSIEYYNVDSTWDSSNYQIGQSYGYFLKSEGDFDGHLRGAWGSNGYTVVDYASDSFYGAYSMATSSYTPPTATIDDIEYTLMGYEAIASAYAPNIQDETVTKLVVPETVTVDGNDYTVVAVGERFLTSLNEKGEFTGNTVIKEVELPDTLRVIGDEAFVRSAIETIDLPEGLRCIGNNAFCYCRGLTKVILPSTLEYVGSFAFSDLAEDSTLYVKTPCMQHVIETANKSDRYITSDYTRVIKEEGVSDDAGHKLLWVEACSATCENRGFSEYWECCICGTKFSDANGSKELEALEYVDPLGHDWGEWETTLEPTCTEPGSEERTCTRNSYHIQKASLEPLGHDWDEGEITTAPTETSDGVKTFTCKRCGETREEVVPMTSWTLKETVEATCETEGRYIYENGLGEVREEPIPVLGHSFTEYVSDNNAACEDAGTKTAHCDREGCSATHSIVDDQNLAFGHAWGEWKTVSEAACVEVGREERVCAHDSTHVDVRETSALGHEYYYVVTEPTCTVGGYTTHTCVRCGDSYTSDETDALGHDWGDWQVVIDATCTEPGSERRICSRDDEHAESRETPALGHDWGEGAVTTEPTCTADGVRTFTCATCGEARTEAIPALGHDYHATVTAPTCASAGYTTHTCSRCGDSYADSKTAALGHSWDAGKVTTAPTCTANGVRTYTCARCGATRTEAIAKLPKLAQTVAPAKKTYTVKLAKVKKKAQKIAVKFKASGNGKITYKAAKTAGGKVKIAKNGKVTVAKGTKKGPYTLKVKVTAAATTSHNAVTQTIKLKIRVK